MSSETILYSILAGILALLLALFQYLYKSNRRTKVYYILAFLRFVTLFSVFLLIINPKFNQITYYNEKPNLLVAVDNSQSVAYLDQDEQTRKILSDLKSNKELNKHFNLEVYTFGKDVKLSDTLTFSEKQSNTSLVFDRLSQVYNNTTSPTILISDGNQTYGNDYSYVTNRYKQPVFPVILGDTTKYIDLKIQQLNVNRYAYLKNKFPVELIAVYNGATSINSELKISSGNSIVYSKKLTFDPDNSSQIINLTLPANRVGIGTHKAELIPIANEKNTVNNVKNFAVEVIDQKTNVAIISDILHPDLGALNKAVESNEQRQATIMKPSDFLKQSNDFQLVILYQPNYRFKLVYDEIEKLKLNCFVVLGAQTNWLALNNFQKNYFQEITYQTEEFQPILNPNYTTFIVDDLNFSDFPPLKSEFGETKFSVPIETILFKSVNGTQLNEPLLATFEFNKKKEAVLLGEGIWKWRAQSFVDSQSFEIFDNFMGKIIQYLSSNQKRNRLNVNFESFYNGNEDVRLNAQYFNKNYEFDKSAALKITLTNEDDMNTTTYPFVLKNTNYEVDLSGLAPGNYTFIVEAPLENLSKSGEFKILDYNVEQQFLNANVEKLSSLAANTAGTAYFIDDTSALVSNLLKDSRFITVQKSSKNVVPLIDWIYLLILITICLSAEWFIRKYNGLI